LQQNLDINRNAPCEHPSSASAMIDVEILNGGELYMCDKCLWVMCYVYKSILRLRCEAFLVMFWIQNSIQVHFPFKR
jgi:hypothetical protein